MGTSRPSPSAAAIQRARSASRSASSSGTSAPAIRRPKGASGKARTGPRAARRWCSSTGQAARQSHHRSDEKPPSNPAPASAAVRSAASPGVQARAGRSAPASRARDRAPAQTSAGTRSGDRQRKPRTPAPASVAARSVEPVGEAALRRTAVERHRNAAAVLWSDARVRQVRTGRREAELRGEGTVAGDAVGHEVHHQMRGRGTCRPRPASPPPRRAGRTAPGPGGDGANRRA